MAQRMQLVVGELNSELFKEPICFEADMEL